jgi:MFS family permease
LWSAFFLGAGGIVVGLANQFVIALVALLAATTAVGVGMPVRQSYLHHVIPSEQRATVVSFDAMISGVGGVGGQVGLGRLAETQGYSAGYVVGGGIALLALPVLRVVRKRGGDADMIVTERAGASAACAAQGMPAVSGVESPSPEVLV